MRKTTFPEGDASNNQLARYLYYTGRYLQFGFTDKCATMIVSYSESRLSNWSTPTRSAVYSKLLGKRRSKVLSGSDLHSAPSTVFFKFQLLSDIRFRKTVHKFSIIVQLLLGEIPDRSIFSQKVMVFI